MHDANEMAEGKTYYAAAGLNSKPDNKLMAIGRR